MKKQLTMLCTCILLLTYTVKGQQSSEFLDRGVVAVKSTGNDVFVSWRLLETDPADIGFNIYRSTDGGDPLKLNNKVLTLNGGTNYTDVNVDLSKNNEYIVRPVLNGVEQVDYLKSGVEGAQKPTAGNFTLNARTENQLKANTADPCVVVNLKSGVLIHFVWVGDLNGDGALDYIVDRLDWTNGGCKIEAYLNNGTYLWTIDYGPNSKNMDNISPGSATIDVGNWDGVTVGDVNGDGKAEVITKIANGVVFGDGSTWTNSDNNKQWMAVLEGATGKLLKYCAIPTDYLSIGPLACSMGVGNNNEIFAKFKNRNSDGSFNYIACDFKMSSSLTLKWKWLRGSTNAPDGHQIRIVDLNGDGVDDFVDIGFALNGTNGSLLYSLASAGILHGDRFDIGKFDKGRAGLQGYGIQQNNPSGLLEYYYDATTGQILWKHMGAVTDVGRGNAADVDPNYGGVEVWSFSGLYNGKSNTLISSTAPYPCLRMQWDGDILDELYNDGKIEKWNYTTQAVDRLVTTWNYNTATSSDRGAPMFLGDIMGDWREEAILTSSDYSKLVIFTTNISTTISRTSFRNDRYYLNCLSTKGYVQSSYTSYYMGDQTKSAPVQTSVNTEKSSLEIFPNPVSGATVDISFSLQNKSNSRIEIYDLNSKLVLSKELPITAVCKITQTLDISSLSKGTFIVKVITPEITSSSKLIKL
ncbi:MAG TPA: T9SS type A sorting domain-containing protein [Bacteroidales bacterium]